MLQIIYQGVLETRRDRAWEHKCDVPVLFSVPKIFGLENRRRRSWKPLTYDHKDNHGGHELEMTSRFSSSIIWDKCNWWFKSLFCFVITVNLGKFTFATSITNLSSKYLMKPGLLLNFVLQKEILFHGCLKHFNCLTK